MLELIKYELENTFKDFEDDEIYLLAATSADEETTQKWIEQIKEYFPGKEVLCDNLSLGISCHTGEGALGIGLSCKPRI
jgi:fatty acid-binding protein DegV